MSGDQEHDLRTLQRKAQSAAEARRFDEALAICDLLISSPETRSAGLRQRASVKELQGQPEQAIADLQAISTESTPEPSDLHALALLQLEIGQTRDAVVSFGRCIEVGRTNDFHYYDKSAHFFRAIANMKLGELDDAMKDCSSLPPGYSTHVIGEGVVTREQIVAGIEARRGSALK